MLRFQDGDCVCEVRGLDGAVKDEENEDTSSRDTLLGLSARALRVLNTCIEEACDLEQVLCDTDEATDATGPRPMPDTVMSRLRLLCGELDEHLAWLKFIGVAVGAKKSRAAVR